MVIINNSGKINYNYNLSRAIVIVGIIMLFAASIFMPLDFSANGAPNDAAGNVTIHFTETNGKSDYVIFGEATESYDGFPPTGENDPYDAPKSPPPPQEPYVRSWFDDSLDVPFDKLWADYRTYPSLSKIWNLSVKWKPSDTSPTDITITWNIAEVISSEYASMVLYDYNNNVSLEMTTNSTYSINASANFTYHFQIIATNDPPYTPSNPNPINDATDVSVNANLEWSGGDPDVGDIVTYDVYLGTTNPPQQIRYNQSTTTCDPGKFDSLTGYYWKIVAWDNHNASTPGPIWSFTTEQDDSSGGGGGGGGGIPPPENLPPVADASAGEPYYSFVNTEILFNGTSSYDQDDDGYITSWEWNFGDGTFGSGEITLHIYSEIGVYTAKLTVTDNEGLTNTDTFEVEIVKANNPPTKPDVQGDVIGTRNTEYIYSAVSTDEDNDTIQYIFNWDDGTNTTTDFLPNGTKTTQNHSWNKAGRYTITVQATDNETYSQTAELIVMIDAIDVGDIGYLTDDDGDEIYDTFHNKTIVIETSVELLENGTYLIDSDGDGVWDYYYNTTSGMITQYLGESTGETGEGVQWLFIAVIGIALVIIAVIVYLYKKGTF
jgi:hypothetical protein